MKRIIYFIAIIVLASALYSCSKQYDNIDRYATDESVYVGKYSDIPYVQVGYKRVEIELMGDSVGRAFSDDIYLGKATKTVIEYDEADGLRRIEFDSVCSWVNITGLTTPKTYIFTIYAEDNEGNKSISTEALAKPYTDADLEGILFPSPHVIEAPTTVEFTWESEASMGLSSPLFKFVELIYSYVDTDGKMVADRLTARDTAKFNAHNLEMESNTTVTINCRIIPIAEAGLILDTISMVKEYVVKTATEEEYLAARTLRPIISAFINPANEEYATITFDKITDHLKWTEIRYKNLGGDYTTLRVENNETVKICPDIVRREPIQIRCAYNPPETNLELISDWSDYGPFIMKYDPRLGGWSALARHGRHNWGNDGVGTQTEWDGGHAMLALDNDPASGWHSRLYTDLPQVFIVDMQTTRRVTKVYGSGGYWITIEVYLTNNLGIDGFVPYKVIWDDGNRVGNYDAWFNTWINRVPADVPATWGNPVTFDAMGKGELTWDVPGGREGRYLIFRFPNSTADTEQNYIHCSTIEVYSD
jgi:hypothetical protein